MTQLLADIALHENRADIRIWGGEATCAYTVKSGSELIDNISYPETSPTHPSCGKDLPHRRSKCSYGCYSMAECVLEPS
jgi:hypothetical protein